MIDVFRLPRARSVSVHDSLNTLSVAVAQHIADLAARAIKERGVFRIALAGGETPRNCYQELSKNSVDWQYVHIYFGDERCLPVDDVGRNDYMVQATMLNHVALPQSNLHRIPAEAGPNAAATAYSRLLQDVTLDLVLLGLGEDGHTASLFPGNLALGGTNAVLPVFDAPKPPPERVTLGLGAINSSREKIILIAGAAKHLALERILRGELLPAARILNADWHIERAAIYGE
ncbi:MAG: 6-phosphogluconolactonase [Gallionella sp.]